MKKILSALFLISFLMVLVLPVMVSAQTPPSEIESCKMRHDLTGAAWEDRGFSCTAKGVDCDFDSTTFTCGVCCLMDTIYTVTDWIFVGIVALVIIFILLGAFNILTAGGSAEKVTAGRQYIIWACVGMLVALLAKAIPFAVRNVLGL